MEELRGHVIAANAETHSRDKFWSPWKNFSSALFLFLPSLVQSLSSSSIAETMSSTEGEKEGILAGQHLHSH